MVCPLRRLHEILVKGGTFDAIYRHILAAPGKRVRAGLVLACADLLPSPAVTLPDAVDLACAMEMFHEASLVHDDICDDSVLRRCTIGAAVVGVDDDGLRALTRYADQFALAFQIMDDLRDVEGGPALGKDAGGDLDRRVPT